MTYYEQGFITKCAELGVDGKSLLKLAQSLSQYDLDDFPSSENQDLSLSSGIYGGSSSPSPKPAPAPAPAPAPVVPQASPAAPTTSTAPTPSPAAATPPASAPAAQPTANSIYSGMSKEQQDAFRNWAQQDGQGKLVGAMFRGQDGKVDRAAMDKFLTENSKFLTGTDEDRKNIIRQHFNSFTPEQQKAFRDSAEYKSYRQAATTRMQARQQTQQQPEKPLPKGWAEWNDPRTGGKVRVQTGSAAAASGAIGRADAYARNAASQGAQPATQTVRRTYTPRNVASFRRNMSVKPLTTTPINQFAGRRKV